MSPSPSPFYPPASEAFLGPASPLHTLAPGRPALIEQIQKQICGQLRGAALDEWRELPLHDVQREFHVSKKLFRGFTGGRGAGKSFVGCSDLLQRAKADRLYMVVGPTYRSLKDTTYRSFLEVSRKIGCLHSTHATDFHAMVRTRDGGLAQVKFRSADQPNSLRGPNLSGCYMDEASMYREETVKILIASLREAGEMGWLSMTFTPKGKQHWTFEWYYDRDGKPKKNTVLLRASSKQNPYLPDQFYDIIADKYIPGSTLARQELEGEFVDLTGLMFQWDWFERVKLGTCPPDVTRVRYWDKAATQEGMGYGDYSAGVLMARDPQGMFWIENVVRGQWSYMARNEIILRTAKRDAYRYDNTVAIWIEQEAGGGGKESAELSLRELAEYPVAIHKPDRASGSKEIRARPFQACAEMGRVKIYDAEAVPGKLGWTQEFLDELCSFPQGRHDDQVDAASGAFNKLAIGDGLTYTGPLVAYPECERTDAEQKKMEAGEQDLASWLARYAQDSGVVGGKVRSGSGAGDDGGGRTKPTGPSERYADWMFGDR